MEVRHLVENITHTARRYSLFRRGSTTSLTGAVVLRSLVHLVKTFIQNYRRPIIMGQIITRSPFSLVLVV